jgi:hypothetical protein
VAQRKTFDPTAVPTEFWQRDDVRVALARREIGRLFGIYLGAYPACTQARLALLTEHDRSDISNFVRGTRSPRVTDIDVLGRIADGLVMSDEARVLLGLAPAETTMSALRAHSIPQAAIAPETTTTGWYRPKRARQNSRIAICGSRAATTDSIMIDEAIRALSRLLMNHHCEVDHGPMGVGIEIMTYIADHYRPPSLRAAVGLFGRPNVVRHADFVLVVGGGHGTLDEMDLAFSMAKRLIPFVASGGAARQAYQRMRTNVDLRQWVGDQVFDALGSCATGEDYARLVHQILTDTSGSDICE